MEIDGIPDIHPPDLPSSGILKWVPDEPTVLTRTDRSTVKAYTSFLACTRTFGPYVDRLRLPNGKCLQQLPEDGSPFSLGKRSLDIFAVNDPYYQCRIAALPTDLPIRTGINVPQFSMPGGARRVQFMLGDYPFTVNECLQFGIPKAKEND